MKGLEAPESFQDRIKEKLEGYKYPEELEEIIGSLDGDELYRVYRDLELRLQNARIAEQGRAKHQWVEDLLYKAKQNER